MTHDPAVSDPRPSSPRLLLWRQNPIFAAIDEAELAALIAHCEEQTVPARQLILDLGQSVEQLFVVLSGMVRIFHRASDGREAVVKLLRAPSVFAEIELFHHVGALECVDAVDEVLLARVPGARYVEVLHRFPAAMFAHLKHLSAAFAVAARREHQVFATLEQRIANLLLEYAGDELPPDQGPIELPVVLSLQDIALSLGAVRRSVARILSAWQKAGTVALDEGRWLLRELPKLEELAEPIRHSLSYRMGMSLSGLTHRPGLATARLEITRGAPRWIGRRFAVDEQVIVGRQAPASVLLPSELISPQHCRVFRAATGGRFWVEDLESLNGTRVNGKEIRLAVLRDGDAIEVGGLELTVRLGDGA